MKPLLGKVALITGASAPQGIGRAIAKRLSRDGASVVVSDMAGPCQSGAAPGTRASLLAALAKEIESEGIGHALACALDVTDSDEIAHCLGETLKAFGPVDILINNAGSLAGSDHFMHTTAGQWEASFRVNLLGPMLLSQAVIPGMKKIGGGRIINIGSTGSLGAEAGFGAYTAMKHGLVGLSKTLAAEFGPDGILCNTVCPGFIATDMHEAANARLAEEEARSVAEIKTRRYASVALRRAGVPEDVAAAVAYLAGPAGDYVTGISLPVSGGVPVGL